MIAFHGQAKTKATYLARVRAHRKADQLIHGTYWRDGKGCAVGCTIHGSDHGRYESELGIPRVLAWLEDTLFERMGNGKASRWPVDFLSAIRVGADLSLVWPRFAVWLLVDKRTGVIRYAKTDAQRAAIQRVADFYGQVIAGQSVAPSEWRIAGQSVAPSEWRAAAAYAADAADAAADDAADAAYAAAYKKVHTRSYARLAVKLLALLKAAPVTRGGSTSPAQETG